MPWFKNPIFVTYVLDPLERASSTFIQQFVGLLIGTAGVSLLVSQNYALAFDAAGFAFLMSLGTSVLTFWIPPQKPLVDLAWRVLKTLLQSFLGTLSAGQALSLSHADWKGALAMAIPVAMAALLKGLAALAQPWSKGASLIPVTMAGVGTYHFTDADFVYA